MSTKEEERLKKAKLALKIAGSRAVKESYLKYVELVHTSVNEETDWKRGKHLVFLCDKVQEFMETDTGNAYDIMVLNLPPQHGKTMSVTETLPSWYLCKNPDRSAIVLAYGDDLAQRFGRRNKEKIDRFGRLFFDLEISKTKSANDDFEIAGHRGRMITRGMMAGITGNPAHLLIIDDPVRTREEAYSTITREKIWQEWQSSVKTRLAAGAKVIVIMTRWHCMVDNTPIICYDGIKEFQNIKVGDTVLTSNGYEKVLDLAIKPNEDREQIMSIRPYYFANPIQCTKDHKILTQRGYVEAKEIKPLKDFVVFPKIAEKEMQETEIESLIPEFKKADFKYAIALKGNKQNVKKEVLEPLLNEGKTYSEIAKMMGYKSRQTIYEYATLYGLNSSNTNEVNRQIVADNDFWWFVGLWLAEGTITYGRKETKSVVRLTLSHKEINFANRIKDCFSKYGIQVKVSHKSEKSITDVRFSSGQIAEFLTRFNLGSHNKEIPSFIGRLPTDKFFYFLYGYWQGDGCFHKRHGYRFSSVSRRIIEGLQTELLKRGYFASSLRILPNKKPSYINGKEIKSGPSYELRVNEKLPLPFMHIDTDPPKRRHAYSDNENYYFKIREATESEYGGYLYDMQTPSHNFVTTSGIVHNCDDLAGAILKTEKNVTHINIPCEAEENDILGREVGDALFPEIGKDREWKDQMKASYIASEGLEAWQAMYQGQPVMQGGNIFKRDWFKFYDDLPSTYQKIMSVDAAFKDTKTSDFVAIGIWGKSGSDVYLEDVVNERLDFVRTVEVIRALKAKYPDVSMILIEDKANGSAIISTLQREIMGIVPVEPLGNKESRAYAIQPFIMAGNVHLPRNAPWVEGYIDQMTRFPRGRNDDMVDMTSQALVRLKDFVANAPSPQQPKPAFRFLDKPKSIYREITGGRVEKSFMNY